jgi:hypothetical protein
MEMATITWSQEYDVNVTYVCGRTGTERWTADIVMGGVLSSSSTYTTDWPACDIIPLPPITDTCRHVLVTLC